MRVYEVTGTLVGKKSGKVTRTIEADAKQDIWNKPESYGFSKLFKVTEQKENMKGNN